MTAMPEHRSLVPALYHPTIAVHDLEAARDWFRRVFGLRPLRWEETLDLDLLKPDYPTNYSFFAFISDIHWVFLCPPLHAQGSLTGQTRYKDVADGMIGLGWYTNDAEGVFAILADAGIRSHDQKGARITSERPPVSSFADDILTGFTEPEDTGIRYEFQQTGRRHWEKYSREADPRLRSDWTGPVLDPEDPLGLLLTSHHTIATSNPARALHLYVELLGAETIAVCRNQELVADSTFIRLADTVVEFAVPNPDTELARAVAEGHDSYLGVSYLVESVDRVRSHLISAGLTPEDTETGAVRINPAEGFGAEWRFIEASPYPLEQRRLPGFD
jgi:catechol 2,3-dioxygenase-like lactoylglutathione lyase family enzyme